MSFGSTVSFGRTVKRYRGAAVLALAAVALTTGCAATGSSGATGAMVSTAASAAAAAPAATAGQPRVAAKPTVVKMARPSATAAPTQPAATQSAATPAAGSPASTPAPPAGMRTVTFVNKVSQTIWVAASPDAGEPLAATGWVLPAGQSVTIDVPNKWNGRFWGRTGCVFNGSGVGHCETGDCGGLFQCTGYGQIPATLAEYDMDAWDGMDFYDVSMVDGSNLPMYINIAKGATPDKISADGCIAAGCTTPVDCPDPLQVKVGGAVVACESACAAFGTDQYCCQGAYSSRAACDPAKWPVDYAAVFKKAEPYAYSYVDDDATSVYTCSGECDYRITFGVTPG